MYSISNHIDFEGDTLYSEWHTLDQMEDTIERTAMTIWTVFAIVGGI